MASSPGQQPNAPSASERQPVAQQLALLGSKRQRAAQQLTTQSSPHLPAAQYQKREWMAWTGFSGKTLWDWLQLSGVIAIPLVVTFATILFSIQQADLAQRQHDAEQELALDQQQEATLKTYLDDMSSLLLDRNLRTSKPDDEIRQIALAKTVIALRRLDPVRKGVLLQFLYGVGLIGGPPAGSYLALNLHDADLGKAFLEGVNLGGAELSRVNLSMADLFHANLFGANLSYADLSRTNLNHADLLRTQLTYTNLQGAHLSGADLKGAYLSGADLRNADLSGADLRDVKMDGTNINQSQLDQVKSCLGAILPIGIICPR